MRPELYLASWWIFLGFYFRSTSGCSRPLGLTTGEIADWQISASSSYPWSWDPGCHMRYARVHQPNGLAWCAKHKAPNEWLLIDLGVTTKVTGVLTQGRADDAEWVVAFMLSFSVDAYHWRYYTDLYGNRKIFKGNTDSHTIHHNYLDRPVMARFVKFYVVEWHKHPSMRVEIMGCQECNQLVSISPYVQITASSSGFWQKQNSCLAQDGHFHSKKAWCPKHSNADQWLQFDLGPPTQITGLVTKGRADGRRRQWVQSYSLSFSNDSILWFSYKDGNHLDTKIFGGNMDKETERRHYLNSPFVSRYVRIHPVTWLHHIALRAGVLGCPHSGECGPGFFRVVEDTGCVENLAFNRLTWVNDKRHTWKDWKYGHSSLAVDGNLDTTLTHCAILDNYYVDYPIWMVDLGTKRDVHGVKIVTWQGRGQDRSITYRDFIYNLERLTVYVENKPRLETLPTSSKCATISQLNNALFRPQLLFECLETMSGRYVYVKVWGSPGRWSRLYTAVLCEVMVY